MISDILHNISPKDSRSKRTGAIIELRTTGIKGGGGGRWRQKQMAVEVGETNWKIQVIINKIRRRAYMMVERGKGDIVDLPKLSHSKEFAGSV